MGLLCFTWSSEQGRAGGDAPSSKNSSGIGAEGKRKGLLRELGGTPHPLPLPAGPSVRKRRGFREFRSGRVLEPPAVTAPPQTEEETLEARSGERTGQPSPAQGEGPRWQAVFLLLLARRQQAGRGFLSLPLGAHRAWELLGPDVVRLPECRPAGEESLASLP